MDDDDSLGFLTELCASIPLHERLLWLSFLLDRHGSRIDPSRIELPHLLGQFHEGLLGAWSARVSRETLH